MKRNVIFCSMSLIIIFSMLVGLTTSTAQSPPPAAQTSPLDADITSPEEVTALPRQETLYFNGLQWGSVGGWNPYSSQNNAMAVAQQDNARVTMFETPYLYDMLDGTQYPLLADGPWSWNAEMTEITFELKPAAHWSDGNPLTAEDVAYTWASNVMYGTDAGNNYKDYIDNITAVDAQTVLVEAKLDGSGEAVNPMMVEAYLSTNYVIQKAWTQTLEARTGSDPDAFKADPAKDVIWSGPYHKLYADDTTVALVRDDSYWGQDASMWGRLPAPKYLAHVIYADSPAGDAAFKAGQVDVSQQFISNVQDLWLVEGLPISTYLPDAPYMIGASMPTAFYNLASYGLDQLAVRKAIAIAVDYNAIIANAMTNQSATFEQVPRSIMNPSPYEQALYDHDAVADLQWTGNDILGAIEILDTAGITDTNGDGYREYNGQTLHYTATCPNGWTDWMAAIEIIADAGQAIGIDITTNYPEWEYDYQNAVTNWPLPNGYDIFMMWSDGAGPTQPWGRIRHLISSEFAETQNNWNGNWGGYKNLDADALIQAIPAETDPAELMADYTALTEIYLTDIPSFSLMYRPQSFHTVNESVWTGFPHQGDGTNPPVPPLNLTDGYSIAGLYNLRLVPPWVIPGEPGLSYRYVETLGETQIPYLADSEHLYEPYGVGVDNAGNLWVSEDRGVRVMKYGSDGIFQLSIGTPGVSGADETHFAAPDDIAVDGAGNIWVPDFYSHRVVKFDPAGNYLTQLGVTWEAGSDNAHFDQPVGVALDSADNLYVSDGNNHRIQIFDSTGVYSATLGTGVPGSGNNQFNTPRHLTFDNDGNLYVADALNHRVQIFDASLTYLATLGTGEPGSGNDHLNWPRGVAVDDDHIYVADSDNNRVQVFDRTTYAYQSTLGSFGSGDYQFDKPPDVAVDPDGNLFVADWYNQRVQKYDSSLVYVRTFGTTGVPYLTDGYHYYYPRVSIDAGQNILISEEEGRRLVKLDPEGNFLWSFGSRSANCNDYLCSPRGVATDSSGKIYVADGGACRVQIISPEGTYLDTLGAGCGTGDDQFDQPNWVAVDNNDNIYVVDYPNHRVQIYNSNLEFIGRIGVTGDCSIANDHLCWPRAVNVDSDGNIYVTELGNLRVQKFDSNYEWQMTIGNGTAGNQFDQFNWPEGIVVDAQRNIYVSDMWNNRIQVFSPSGEYLTTIGGAWGMQSAQFSGASSVSVDNEGNVYASDWGNHRIQKYAPGVPDWNQVNINGFGNPNTANVPSLEVFNDYLYVGTGGNHIYRTMNSHDWEQITQNFDAGVSSLLAFDSQLFAGTWNGSIYSSPDGLNWTKVMIGTQGIAGFGQFNDTLYAGTYHADVAGVIIWQTSDGITWTPFATNGDLDPNYCGVISFSEFEGNLYFGVADWSGNTGAHIWRTDGTNITEVVSDGFGDPENLAPGGLAAFGDGLYASIDTSTSYQVWRSDSGEPGSWSKALDIGVGVPGGRTGLIVLDNRLFLTTQNEVGGMEVWRTADGETWQQIGYAGFGDSNNGYSEWGSGLNVFNGQLYIGANNFANGGEIWRYDPELTAGFTAEPTVGIAPLEVTFTNISSGTLTSSLWDFGDGSTSTQSSPVHLYDTTGIYTVTLTADSFGNRDTITKASFITVYTPVSADFSASPTSGPFPLTVTFTNLSTGDFDTCLWDFGDTFTSTLCTPADHAYLSQGVYTVTLIASGLGGSDIETKDGFITVYTPVSADFSASPTSGPFPLTVAFTNLSTGDFDTCLWDFGDTVTSTLCTPADHVYLSQGVYNVTLTASGLGGSDIETKASYIMVNTTVSADFSASPTSGPIPLTVAFTNLSTGDFDTCLWDFGDTFTSTLCTPADHVYLSQGVYNVTLTASGLGGSDIETKDDYITVYTPVSADFSASPTFGPVPLTVSFTNLSAGDFDTCLWNFGDTYTSTLCSPPEHVYLSRGVYNVTLTASGLGGSDSETKDGYITVENQKFFLPLVRR